MDVLELRICHLETLLQPTTTTSDDTETPARESALPSVPERLEHAEHQFRNLTKKVLFIDEFLVKYESVRHLVEEDNLDAAAERLSLSAKLEILQSASGAMTTLFDQLREMENLTKFVNPPEFEAMVARTSDVRELATRHQEQAVAYQQLSAHVIGLIDTYNNTVNSLSEVFLMWDSALAKLEAKVRVLEKKV
ncbi:hypothetical protein IWQ60_003172 [Tieghemiomyces parasiticus]|uniref:Dynactin subunit 3 n=1 Tax=Tieghemiomyces parasiticus TaxID=78921 RepID=A0A9W8AA36_9FUNG|nr:hypothetical protein IWQ60_003172 [Tieghemiomyces parasiticus]